LTPEDWLLMLNARVFFWPDEMQLSGLVRARANRGRRLAILSFDTLALAKFHMERLELCPINSGATMRKPARRGISTFTPALSTTYHDSRRRRGKRDDVKEIAVRGGVPDAENFLRDVRMTQ
jgi:hypothetical protein